MADNEGLTLDEMRQRGVVIPATPPKRDTILGIGQDPASMRFEQRDEASDGVPSMDDHSGSDPRVLTEVPLVDDPPSDDEIAEIIGTPAEGVDLVMEWADDEQIFLLCPIGKGTYQVAASLPYKRYMQLVKTVSKMQQTRQGQKLSDMSIDELEEALGTFGEIVRLGMEDDEWERLSLRFDDLRDPVGPQEIAKPVGALMKRWMGGTGATEGKQQG